MTVLYSFPHKIGAGRICHIAWQQVAGLAEAGVQVVAYPGVVHRPLPHAVRAVPTLARGRLRISYKLFGTLRSCRWHDQIVGRRLSRRAHNVTAVHGWPLGSLETFTIARKLSITSFLERPNAHTRYAYEAVRRECDRIGVRLPPGYEHAYDAKVLAREEREYATADYILCPSAFVAKTFIQQGFAPGKLLRHTYGYDERRFFPEMRPGPTSGGLTVLFAGICAVRKGLHLALDAWLNSSASTTGRFLIAGTFLPAYREKLRSALAHPSVHYLGQRNDLPELMRKSDVLVLPSIEEGFGLVIAEAMGSGCVPLVSSACADIARHGVHGFVHEIGDVHTLSTQLTLLDHDRNTLNDMRAACISEAPHITWKAAALRLANLYTNPTASYTDAHDNLQ